MTAPFRRRLLKALALTSAAALLTAGCAAGTGEPGDAEPTVYRLGHTFAVDSLPHRASVMLQERVEELSDGRIAIEVYPSGQLGSWEEMQEGLEIGSLDFLFEALGSLERYSPSASIEPLPFLYDSPERFIEVWESPLADEILETVREESGFIALGKMPRTGRMLNTTTPVESLADLSGKKIRVPNQVTYLNTWEALGAAPTPLSFNEIFSALEQGAIDGQENPIDLVQSSSFFEVAPYVAVTNHLFANFHFLAWDDSYQSLPEEDRAILEEAIADVSTWYAETSFAEEAEVRAELEAAGVIFTEVDIDEWREATRGVIENADPQVREWAEEILSGGNG